MPPCCRHIVMYRWAEWCERQDLEDPKIYCEKEKSHGKIEKIRKIRACMFWQLKQWLSCEWMRMTRYRCWWNLDAYHRGLNVYLDAFCYFIASFLTQYEWKWGSFYVICDVMLPLAMSSPGRNSAVVSMLSSQPKGLFLMFQDSGIL